MKENLPIIDIHAHLVIYEPDGYPNKFLHRLSDSGVGFWVLKNILKEANPFSDNDKLNRLVQFIESNRNKNWRSKFFAWKKEGQWSERTKIVVLTVNMAHMGCGMPKKTFGEACEELERLRQDFPDIIIPFLHYDCRCAYSWDLFQKYVVNGDWAGVKLYSSMGTFPDDPLYDRMYEQLQIVGKPVIAHCTYSNPIHFLGEEADLEMLLGTRYDEKASRKQNCDKFTNPRNIFNVARRYPNILFDLAHLGGINEWKYWYENPYDENGLVYIILEGMKELPNVYGDISFSANHPESYHIFSKLYNHDDYTFLKDRLLFGTDWDMTKSEVNLKQWSDGFRYAIGESVFNQIARVNNHHFLYSNLKHTSHGS